jgi:hypothetical protein
MYRKLQSQNLSGTDQMTKPGAEGKIIIKLTLQRMYLKVWATFCWIEMGPRGRFFEHCFELWD